MAKKELSTQSAAVPKKNALESLANRLQVDSKALEATLRKTAFKECKTNEEFVSAVIVANTYGLNPLLKQLYAFPSKGGGVMPIVSIDGWIAIVNRHPDFNGIELRENKYPEGAKDTIGTGIESVTAIFSLKNKEKSVIITEYMEECYDGSKTPWKKWPRRMLRHKAYMQGARIAFGFSGIYDEDEAMRITECVDLEPTGKPIVSMPEEREPQEAIQPKKSPLSPVAEAQEEEVFSGLAQEVPIVAPTPAPEQASDPKSYAQMITAFNEAKGVLGDKLYASVLARYDYKDAVEIPTKIEGKAIMAALQEAHQQQGK